MHNGELFMYAQDMEFDKRYKDKKGRRLKLFRRFKNCRWVQNIKNRYIYVLPLDYEVEHVYKGKGRLNKKEFGIIINYIKTNMTWYKESKTYITFLKDNAKYKLHYAAQKLLSRYLIGNIKCEGKYKNGYYAYKIINVKKYIMEK